MFVRVITPPEPFVTWEEAQPHLRAEDEDQVYVEGLLLAACGWLDGPGGWLGRAIGVQTLELVDCAFGNDRLPFPPLVSIESITYFGTDDVDHELTEADYRQLLNGSISPPINGSWPSVGSSSEAVRIVYVAGYPDTGDDPPASTVPQAIKQAVLLLIGHWYRNRETVVVGETATDMPMAVEALLSTYRVWR
jgi:uncharacterized phiE125 gp8 family phage protein